MEHNNNKRVVIIYDQNDLIDQGGSLSNHINNLTKHIGEDYINKKTSTTSDDVLKSEIFTLELNSGIQIIHVHESQWDYDYDNAELLYGENCDSTKNLVFNSDTQKLMKNIRTYL